MTGLDELRVLAHAASEASNPAELRGIGGAMVRLLTDGQTVLSDEDRQTFRALAFAIGRILKAGDS